MREREMRIERAMAFLAAEARRVDGAAMVVNVRGRPTLFLSPSPSEEDPLQAKLRDLDRDGGILVGTVGWRKTESSVEFQWRLFPFTTDERTTRAERYLTDLVKKLVEELLNPVLRDLRERITRTGFPFESEEG